MGLIWLTHKWTLGLTARLTNTNLSSTAVRLAKLLTAAYVLLTTPTI